MEIDIDALAAAIADQCGLRATVRRTFTPGGLKDVAIQVALQADAKASRPEHWRWFEASTEQELPRLRDEVTDFIIRYKQEAA